MLTKNGHSEIQGSVSTRMTLQQSEGFIHSTYELECALCDAISNGDLEGAEDVQRKIRANSRAELSGDSLQSMKNSCVCCCTLYARAAIRGGVPPEEAFTLSDILINHLDQIKSQEDADEFAEVILRRFVITVQQSSKRGYSLAIRRAMTLIDNSLMEKFTVAGVAKKLNMHPNYLSSRFKKEVGETITRYSMRKRVEAAAQLLCGTNLSAAEISTMFGFCNQSYFIRAFRRILGCSPGEYRQHIIG